jgi:hypothetical protein
MNTDRGALIESLHRMPAQEHACAVRYATAAAVVTGPNAETTVFVGASFAFTRRGKRV